MSQLLRKIVFILLIILCLTPFVNAPIALILGFVMVSTIGNPFTLQSAAAVKSMLKAAIIGLGFGINVFSAVKAGKEGFILTIGTISLVLLSGWILGRLLKVDPKTSHLISSGTAICGGSAIAAISPIIDANSKQISLSLAVVFILNAVALLIFPYVGHYFELTQHQFGLWCAIAIHDTSSVIGAAATYGSEALNTATTVKLGRALWIIPLSIVTVFVNRTNRRKITIPYFIVYFIIAMVIGTFFPDGQPVFSVILQISRKLLVVTLFLIGSGLSYSMIKTAGGKTLIYGMTLWLIISIASLMVISALY